MDRELIYVFGTGNAAVTKLYNTCFALRNQDEYFMVDAGGGNGILRILENMEIPLSRIHHIFVSHEHTDHILGIVWMVRMIASKMRQEAYEGDAYIFCHEELVETITTLCRLTIQKKFFDMLESRIHLVPLKDGEKKQILDYEVTFFDIHSTKAKQFGFTLLLNNGQKLTFLGDEPYNPACEAYVRGTGWLLHEAFCLYADRDLFKPYEKHHSTALDAGNLAEKLKVRNLVLYHTEDTDLKNRKKQYTKEVKLLYSGNVYVPDDLEVLKL